MFTMFTVLFFVVSRRPPRSTRTDTLFPYTTLFRSARVAFHQADTGALVHRGQMASGTCVREVQCFRGATHAAGLGHLYKQFNLGPAVHRRLIVSRVGKVFSSLGVLKFFLAAYTIF